MKVCPSCRKTYSDDGLNFCLDDGSVLTLITNDVPETVMMNQARFTEPNPGRIQDVQTSYGDQTNFTMQPKKSSKTWVWVLLILGAVLLACGGGFGAFLIYVASLDPGNNSSTTSPTPTPRTSPSATPPRTDVKTANLPDWVQDGSEFGNTSYSGGELVMSSKKKGFYYVIAASTDFKTERASTSVTIRAIDDERTNLGYGLVFHSNPKPLQKGYAFLIDARSQRYRIVRHEPGKEMAVVPWTNSSAIRSGSSENKLEVRDLPDRIEIYANGEMLTSIKNTHGYAGGVVGLYTGDAIEVAFKELEIAK
ncbi:MAG: hypothetical protein AB7Q37_16970 [Pyrinomonadaceae bacterium]